MRIMLSCFYSPTDRSLWYSLYADCAAIPLVRGGGEDFLRLFDADCARGVVLLMMVLMRAARFSSVGAGAPLVVLFV
jgi:hypothetical protein